MGQLLQNLGEIWRRAGLTQRVMLLGVLLACAAAAVMLVGWARQPNMCLLYSKLTPDEAGRIVEKIRDADIPYKLKDGGTTVFVPEEKVYSLRLSMASQGLPVGDQVGYRILDEEKIGTSSFTQRVNYIRAVEGELAKTIQLIDSVEHARVHVVRPESTLFQRQENAASATVALRLKGGRRMSQTNIAAILNLVAGAVEGLSPEKVVVVDSRGNLLSTEGGNKLAKKAGTMLNYKTQVEEYLSDKAETLLASALGPKRARVKVSAVIDINSINTTTETYDAVNRVVVEETVKTSSSTPPAGGAGKSSASKEEDIVTKYVPSVTREQTETVPGQVKSLQVAAFVDLSAPEPKEGEEAPPAAKLTVKDVEEIIRNAIGVTANDSIKVVDTKFPRSDAELAAAEAKEPGLFSKGFLLNLARRGSLGVLVIGMLLALKMLGGAKKASGEGAPALEGQASPAAGMLPGQQVELNAQALRGQITRALQDNPEEVRRLFLRWAESGKGES